MYRYDTTSNTWVDAPSLPVALIWCGCTEYNGKGLVCGGTVSFAPTVPSPTVAFRAPRARETTAILFTAIPGKMRLRCRRCMWSTDCTSLEVICVRTLFSSKTFAGKICAIGGDERMSVDASVEVLQDDVRSNSAPSIAYGDVRFASAVLQ